MRALLTLAAIACLPGSLTASEPARVISVGGAVTEIIYGLGAEGDLVAVDSTSTRPSEASALPDVGYMRALSAEGLLALKPDLIVASSKAGPTESLEAVRKAGVEVARIEDEPSLEGIRQKIVSIADRLGRQEQAKTLLADFDRQVTELREATDGVEKVRTVFLMSRGDGILLAAGRGTAADAILELAGAENVMNHEGYKPVSAEALLALAPEAVVTGTRTAEAFDGAAGLAEHQAVALTPAGKAGRVLVMDDLVLLGFGPETPKAARELATRLH